MINILIKVMIILAWLVCLKVLFLPLVLQYKNTKDFTNGSIRINEGIEGSQGYPDFPAGLDIRIPQVRANKNGVCDIKTGKEEIGYISLEHLNMLDHFAHRYLEKNSGQWHGDCRLIIDGKQVEGKDLK